jgi:hypothetical protein
VAGRRPRCPGSKVNISICAGDVATITALRAGRVAAMSPNEAWQQPPLRLFSTVVGMNVKGRLLPAVAGLRDAIAAKAEERKDNHPPLAGLRLLPAPRQEVELLVAADQRCGPRTQCLEAADDPALADHTPGTLWLGKTGERLGTEILDLEQGADLSPGAGGLAFRRRRPRSCAAPSPIRSPTTTRPVAMPIRTFSGSCVASRPTASMTTRTTPRSFRSSAVKPGNTSSSISFSRKACSYRSSPSPRSQLPMPIVSFRRSSSAHSTREG